MKKAKKTRDFSRGMNWLLFFPLMGVFMQFNFQYLEGLFQWLRTDPCFLRIIYIIMYGYGQKSTVLAKKK